MEPTPEGTATTADPSRAGGADLPLTEWVVLAVLAEAPSHGFAVARELRADSDLGRILTVHRPLVYRALDRLVDHGFAEPQRTEPGDAGPNRTVHAVTAAGAAALDTWVDRPVAHVRDLRIEFLVKVRLAQRRGRDTNRLVTAQQGALADTLGRLASIDGDVVDRWRRHNALAASAFLSELADVSEPAEAPDSAGVPGQAGRSGRSNSPDPRTG